MTAELLKEPAILEAFNNKYIENLRDYNTCIPNDDPIFKVIFCDPIY